MTCCSGRRRSCAVHNGIKAASSPCCSFPVKIKSTPLSCVGAVQHTAPRRTASSHWKHHHPTPWLYSQCSSMPGGVYRQQTAGEVGGQVTLSAEHGRLYDDGCCSCGCEEESEGRCRLLADDVYATSRMKLSERPQSQSPSRSCTQHATNTSPSRTVLLLGTD